MYNICIGLHVEKTNLWMNGVNYTAVSWVYNLQITLTKDWKESELIEWGCTPKRFINVKLCIFLGV